MMTFDTALYTSRTAPCVYSDDLVLHPPTDCEDTKNGSHIHYIMPIRCRTSSSASGRMPLTDAAPSVLALCSRILRWIAGLTTGASGWRARARARDRPIRYRFSSTLPLPSRSGVGTSELPRRIALPTLVVFCFGSPCVHALAFVGYSRSLGPASDARYATALVAHANSRLVLIGTGPQALVSGVAPEAQPRTSAGRVLPAGSGADPAAEWGHQ